MLVSGKTSMLFAYAYSYAQENRPVLFICSKKKIQNNLPIFPSGLVPSPAILDKIQMKYVLNFFKNFFLIFFLFVYIVGTLKMINHYDITLQIFTCFHKSQN